MALSSSVGLSGEDHQKCPFTMPAKATNLNRHGAAIHVARQLSVGSVLTIRNMRGTQISARVVAKLAVSKGVSAYGMEFVASADVSNGFWGINFPQVENRVGVVQIADQAGIARRRLGISTTQA